MGFEDCKTLDVLGRLESIFHLESFPQMLESEAVSTSWESPLGLKYSENPIKFDIVSLWELECSS